MGLDNELKERGFGARPYSEVKIRLAHVPHFHLEARETLPRLLDTPSASISLPTATIHAPTTRVAL